MEKDKKITAICGWALSEKWFCERVKSYFPESDIRAYYPKDPGNEDEAADVLGLHTDWVLGYSLGSLWILSHKNKIPKQAKIVLMAPILAFPEEKDLGGKVPLAKLKYQKKILDSSEDYLASLKSFFDLSGIRFPENDLYPSLSRKTLLSGLEFLETTSVNPDTAQNCIALCGLRDSLLDSQRLKALIPQLIVLKDCDHSPNPMLSYLAQHGGELHESSSNPTHRQRVV